MINPIRTLEETIAWEHARLGKSRLNGNADWAGGRDVDDCALFQSTAVFGFKAAWNVDVFETIGGGTYHRGKAGLRRGDVVLFNWVGSGPPAHTEMALEPPTEYGAFQTIGANRDATAAVKEGTRNGFVTGYFRPNYKPAAKPTPETKPKPAAPAAPDWSKNMYGFVRKTSNGEVAVVNSDTGKKRPLHKPEWLGYEANGAKFAELSDADYDGIPTAK